MISLFWLSVRPAAFGFGLGLSGLCVAAVILLALGVKVDLAARRAIRKRAEFSLAAGTRPGVGWGPPLVGIGCALLFAIVVYQLTTPSGLQILSDASRTEYAASECAKWIAIPPNARSITATAYLGFDTNYRYLRCQVDPDDGNLPDLIKQGLAAQPRPTNDTLVLVGNASITLEKMRSAFPHLPKTAPPWWRSDFARFDQQSYCAWDDQDHGYGYVYLLDSSKRELRAFQWSQQHTTAADIVAAFGR